MTTAEVTAEPVGQVAALPVTARPRPLPARWAVPLAALAGGAMLLAFPPYAQWWLAPVAVALLAVAVHRRRLRSAALLGLLAGVIFFVPLLSWTDIVGGKAPWLILAIFEAIYLALMTAIAAFISPLVDRHRWTWPLVTGLLWVCQEAVRDRVPFGGFPWGRLAFSQSGSPLLRVAVLGGAPLVTFAVALCGGLLALGAWRLLLAPREQAPREQAAGDRALDERAAGGEEVAAGGDRAADGHATDTAAGSGGARRIRLFGLAAMGGAVLVVLAGLVVPTATPNGRAVSVAVIQGNVPRMGLEFNAQRRAVLDNHVNATLDLARQVAAGQRAQPDLVVWPENSSDIDPLVPADADARQEINGAAAAIKAPILVGAVLQGPGDHARNASIVWQPGVGPTGPIYVKQHPVPFAEYIPLRSIARLVTDKVDLVQSDFVAGTRSGVMDTGPAVLGDVICFEVAYDDLVRATVTGGAQLIAVQTNNADFNTAEARQQLSMVQERAVESGRDGLMASTVGVSAFVGADGKVSDATQLNTRAILVRQLRLGEERTLATDIGPFPEYIMVGLGLLALVGAARIRRRRARTQEEK